LLPFAHRPIAGNYCAYPAVDSDTFFAGLRNKSEWAEIRSAAMQCQKTVRDKTSELQSEGLFSSFGIQHEWNLSTPERLSYKAN
jgi:hypothetical protein